MTFSDIVRAVVAKLEECAHVTLEKATSRPSQSAKIRRENRCAVPCFVSQTLKHSYSRQMSELGERAEIFAEPSILLAWGSGLQTGLAYCISGEEVPTQGNDLPRAHRRRNGSSPCGLCLRRSCALCSHFLVAFWDFNDPPVPHSL